MFLTALTFALFAQGDSSSIVSSVKGLFPAMTVEGTKRDENLLVTIRHEERFSGGGGQRLQSSKDHASETPLRIACTDQFLAVPIGPVRGADTDHHWLPDQDNYRVLDAAIGVGGGYRWYGHATFDTLRRFSEGLNLTGGELFSIVAIRALREQNYRSVAPATDYLLAQKDQAVDTLKSAAPSIRQAIGILSAIRTPKAIKALLELHQDKKLKADVQASLAYGKAVEDARPIYEAGIANEDAEPYCARTALRFGWKNLQPAVKTAYGKAQGYDTALELLDVLHCFQTGASLPSFEKVHNFFSDWTGHDDRAVIAATDKDYAPLCVAKMISIATKGGSPFAKTGLHLADLLVQSGRAADLHRILAKFNLANRLAQVRKSL